MSIALNVLDQFDLPKDLILGAMNIHLTGKFEAYIENYKAIKKYDSNKIIISGRRSEVTITGKNLTIEYFSKTDMKIKGFILEVSFDK